MKILFLLLVFVPVMSLCQNLVPDPGFEIHSFDCEPYPGLEFWFNPTLSSPDLITFQEDGCGVVLTLEEAQEINIPFPYEGNSCVGLFVMESEDNFQTREYLSSSLISSLEAGGQYVVRFKIRRSSNWDLAIDKIGVLFTSSPVSVETSEIIQLSPQIETDQGVLANTEDWIDVQLLYTAEGNEQYVTLGNFRDANETVVEDTNSSVKDWNSGYYYFDDVTVESISNSIEAEDISSPKWVVRKDYLEYLGEGTGTLTIFSPLGSVIHESDFHQGSQVYMNETMGVSVLICKYDDGSFETFKCVNYERK